MIIWNILLSIFIVFCVVVSILLFIQTRKLKKALVEIIGPQLDAFDKRIVNLAKEITKRT